MRNVSVGQISTVTGMLVLGTSTPMIRGQGVIAIGAGADGAAGPLMFRLSAPLVLESGAGTPFTFQLLGRTAFRGEQLDRVTHEGDTVRLEGTGRLNGRAGYRFVIDASAGGGSAGASPGRLWVRIIEADPAGGAGRAVFEAGGKAHTGAAAASLRHGTIELIR